MANWSLETELTMSILNRPRYTRTMSLNVKIYYSLPAVGLNLSFIMRRVSTAALQTPSTYFVSSIFLIFSVMASYRLEMYWLSGT